MASTSCPDDVLQASDGKTRFARLARLLICGGTEVMKNLFNSIIPPEKLAIVLSSAAVFTRLNQMKRKKILTYSEWKILFPQNGCVQSTSFDITLLFKLLREKVICGLTPPNKGWNKLPNIGDISLEADMARIKFYRNDIVAHSKNMELAEPEFIDYWKEIKDALVRIEAAKSGSSIVADWETSINKLLTDPLTENDKKNVEELKSWYLDERELKEMIEQIHEKLKGDGKDVRELKQMVQQLLEKGEGDEKGERELKQMVQQLLEKGEADAKDVRELKQMVQQLLEKREGDGKDETELKQLMVQILLEKGESDAKGERELKQMVRQLLEKGEGDGKDVRELKQMVQLLLEKREGDGKEKEEDSVELSRVMALYKPVEEVIFELSEDIKWFNLLPYVYIPPEQKSFNDLPTLKFRYEMFQERASRIGLDLPDMPQDSDAQFYNDQGHRVATYILGNMTQSLIELFVLCVEFNDIVYKLKLLRIGEPRDVPMEVDKKKLELVLNSLSETYLGAEWKEELKEIAKNYTNDDFEQKLGELRERFKRKVCDHEGEMAHNMYKAGKEQKLEEAKETSKAQPCDLGHSSSYSQIKRSEVDPTRVMITEECWAVSLVHLPDRSNPQHAFLVIEGLEDQKSQIWFADFVAVEWFDLSLPGTEQGRVRIEHYHSDGIADQKLLFQCNKAMMDIDASDRLLYTTWIITKSTAKTLLDMIEAQKKKPPKFHALGQTSVSAASCVTSSSNTTGHDCFTFSRKMLLDLNDEFITLPEESFEKWIDSATTRFISSTGERNGLSKNNKCPKKGEEEEMSKKGGGRI